MKNLFKELLDELILGIRQLFKGVTVKGNININIPTNYNSPKNIKRRTKRVVTTVTE